MLSLSSFRRIIASAAFFIFFSQFYNCQLPQLQNDPNIPWIAEFSMDYSFSFGNVNYQQDLIKLIKFYNDPSHLDGVNRDDWIVEWVTNNALNEHYKCFKDPALIQPLSKKNLLNLISSVDTVITYNPETFEESTMIIRNDLDLSLIEKLRIKQIIYFDVATGNFKTKITALAPLLSLDLGDEPIPLFWIKMDGSFPASFDIHDPDISWGTLISTKGNPLVSSFMEEFKNENNFSFRKKILQQAFELEKPIESAEGYGCNHFLDKKGVGDLYSSIDTIITFDPNTFEEKVEIVRFEFNPDEITQFRLIQEWYYDSKQKKLMNRLMAICPTVSVKDGKGNHRYSKPLYYIRYD